MPTLKLPLFCLLLAALPLAASASPTTAQPGTPGATPGGLMASEDPEAPPPPPPPALGLQTGIEGEPCPLNGITGATAPGATGVGLQCVKGAWRRTVSHKESAVSASEANCSSLPRGSFATDSSGKLFVCK